VCMGPKITLLNKSKNVIKLILRSAEVIIASANAQANKGDNQKYDAWYNSLADDQRAALVAFQETLAEALQKDGIKDDFSDLLYGGHGSKGLVHLTVPPEVAHNSVTVQSALGSIHGRVRSLFINQVNNLEKWKNKHTVNCLFEHTTTLKTAHESWLLYCQSQSSLVIASQSQHFSLESQGEESVLPSNKSILQTVRDNVAVVSEQASELMRTHSNPGEAVSSSLPAVPENVARKMAAKKHPTRTTLLPEEDKLLRYLFTIIRFEFLVHGQAWYCPLLFNAAVEDTVFDYVVKRTMAIEGASIVVHQRVEFESEKEGANAFMQGVQSFFNEHDISDDVSVSQFSNKVEVKFRDPQQHHEKIHQLYRQGGYKAHLLFSNSEHEEPKSDVSSHTATSSSAGSKRSSSVAGFK
jgi:hypothetical protein